MEVFKVTFTLLDGQQAALLLPESANFPGKEGQTFSAQWVPGPTGSNKILQVMVPTPPSSPVVSSRDSGDEQPTK